MLKVFVRYNEPKDRLELVLEGDEINRVWPLSNDQDEFHLAMSDGTILHVLIDGDGESINLERDVQGRAMMTDGETVVSGEWDSASLHFYGESFTWVAVNLYEPNILQPES